MKIGRVIGNIWATRKDENLSGLKLLVVQPLNLLNDQPIDTPIVAADIIGAGVGEKILYVGGSSARGAAGGPIFRWMQRSSESWMTRKLTKR